MSNKHVVIPIFIPHKGCPHDCIFCNQKKISGQTEEMTAQKMSEIIESHLKTIKPGANVQLGFYGGSFTGIDTESQIEYLKIANEYVKTGQIKNIRLSTRPDYINETILQYLKHYNVAAIELGVQSLDDKVLKESCRGHTANDVYKASAMIKDFEFDLGIQTMVGLPFDTLEKDISTAQKIIEIGPTHVRIYPVLIIKDTYLEKMYLEGDFSPITLEEAVIICSKLMMLYEESGINVIRVGLQTSENINDNSEITAGPFHPAFRQLVEAKLTLSKIEEQIIQKGLFGVNGINIKADTSRISNISGNKKSNIAYLKTKYRFKFVKIYGYDNFGKAIDVY